MKYIKKEGSNKHLIITLHGTGGNASSLFQIADIFDPMASKVGFQGEVNENGMSRYFARYPGGGFDLESLKRATHDLHNSIIKFVADYGYENHMITILGYSNGANIAKNLLKEFKDVKINNILMFHPSLITPEIKYKQQKDLNVFITSGKNDPYISELEFKGMVDDLRSVGINVVTYTHDQGHQLIQKELDNAKVFLSKLKGA